MADCEPEPEEIISKISMLNTTDPKANFICGSKGELTDLGLDPNNIAPTRIEYVDLRRVDYMIDKDVDIDQDKDKEDKQKTLSYMNVNSVEEGIEWYKENYPKIPEDLFPIMARWNWGDIGEMTKKEIKNDVKRLKKGKRTKQMGLEHKTGKFVVDFN
jgi:hypothetical protein